MQKQTQKQETSSNGSGAKPVKKGRQKKNRKVHGVVVDSVVNGDIITTIFVNRNDRGEDKLRVVQDRKYVYKRETYYAESFRPRDLVNVARGALWARRWVQERHGFRWRRRPVAWS
jgi:hypothetical protein